MKRLAPLLTFLFITSSSVLFGQDYPSEWRQFTQAGYISDIQHDRNLSGHTETDFKNYLTDIARTNIGRQIQIRISDHASLNKASINGRSYISYTSSTKFSTDLNIKLIETKAYYNSFTKEGYSIAYIDESKAISTYIKDVRIIYNKISNAIAIADTYVSTGFKTKAGTELENARREFSKLEEPYFWLAILNYPENDLNDLLLEKTSLEQTLTHRLSELQHGINIYVQCSADMFGTPYLQLEGDIKEPLSTIGCNFCNDANDADWIITVRSAAEEYNHITIGGNSAYFSYVHANISLTKTATQQVIYNGEISEKGSHTHNYNQAARDGYKKISQQISEILLKHIK